MSRRFEEAEAVLAQALPKLQNCGLRKLLGLYHGSVATLKSMTGDQHGARAHFGVALSLFLEAGSETSALESMSNLADVSWSLGDLAGAEASLREYIAMRGTSYVRRVGLGFALGNLAGVLTERGRLSQAREAAAEALPLLAEAGNVWVFMDHFALRTAIGGDERGAARLAGFADTAYASKHAARPPNEARARNRLQSLLEAAFDRPELERLLAEGEGMTEDEACRLAVEG
jgi:tetratricopeptide (TPR) repeat protein